MKAGIPTVVALGVFFFSTASGQDTGGQVNQLTEFLEVVAGAEKNAFVSNNELAVRSEEFFAHETKFHIYKFDIDVLKEDGRNITISLENEDPITVVSHGIKREADTGWHYGAWSGDVLIPNSRETYPISLNISSFGINSSGRLVPPDPNRDYFRAQQDQEISVFPAQSYARRNEKIVHSITGTWTFNHLGKQYSIVQLQSNLDYAMIYEVDIAKRIHTYDRMNGLDEIGLLLGERAEEYKRHVAAIKNDMRGSDSEEN